MTPSQLRDLVRNAEVYKMSLGRKADYQDEARQNGVLVFHSETTFYDAVVSGNETEIRKAGRHIILDNYPKSLTLNSCGTTEASDQQHG